MICEEINMTYTDNFIILPYEGDIKEPGEIIDQDGEIIYEPWG